MRQLKDVISFIKTDNITPHQITFYKVQNKDEEKPQKPEGDNPVGWTESFPTYNVNQNVYESVKTIISPTEYSYSDVILSMDYEATRLSEDNLKNSIKAKNDIVTETTNYTNTLVSNSEQETRTLMKEYTKKTEFDEYKETATSTLNQTAESINAEVSKKVGNDEIISKINQSAEEISIEANKINLKGAVTAEDMNVSNLSSISANIGTVTAGILKSNNYVANKTGSLMNLNDGSFSYGGGNLKYDATNGLQVNGLLTLRNKLKYYLDGYGDCDFIVGECSKNTDADLGATISFNLPGAAGERLLVLNSGLYSMAGGVKINTSLHCNDIFCDSIEANGSLSAKTIMGSDVKAFNGWFYSSGNTGWCNDSYGGGWYMNDNTWIRVYGGKKVYIDKSLKVGAGGAVMNFIACNTTVVKPNGGTSVKLFSQPNIASWGGTDDGNKTVVFVSNGDASCTAHIDGATYNYSDRYWYATFDKSVTSNIRINFTIITWE